MFYTLEQTITPAQLQIAGIEAERQLLWRPPLRAVDDPQNVYFLAYLVYGHERQWSKNELTGTFDASAAPAIREGAKEAIT